MSNLIISKKNEIYLQVEADPHVYYELRDTFQFEVPNAKFSPAYKNKWWDGKIYMFNVNTREIYVGLLDRVIQFCKNHDYTYEFKDNKFYGLPFEVNPDISREGVKDYVTAISRHTPRNYQIAGIYEALRYNRKVIVSPTGSGKSLMIYAIARYFQNKDKKTLIIVPTTSLVSQMFKDFEDYGYDAENHCHMIYSGREKESDKEIYISTWQSLVKLPKPYFQKFDCVICDECFSGDMRVLTPDGYVKIKDLNEGDIIINYDENKKEFKEDTILKTHKNIKKSAGEKMYRLKFDDGTSIDVTGNHKFLTEDGWVRADMLTENHNIINKS